jgi:hypothetical protein
MLDGYLEETFKDCVRSEADLFPEQREAIEFAWSKPFSALFLDVGKGKTAISLTIMDRMWMQGYTGKFLVIAPIRVATRVWPYESKLWRHLAYQKMTVIRIDDDDPRLKLVKRKDRTAEKDRLRRALLDSPAQIHVINQEAVHWLVEACWDRKSWPYKVVFFDESSRLRDHNSVVFKALKRVRSKIQRFHQLTATPASQHYMSLFSQVFLLDGGERFGRGVTAFRERYFTQNRYTHRWTIREGVAEEIEKKIADICFVIRGKREFEVRTRSIQLSDETMQQYNELQRTYLLEVSDDEIIEAVHAAALSSKLLQLASGAVYGGDGKAHTFHDEKIDELKELVEQLLGQPLIVSYWFKHSLVRLKQAFPTAVVMGREGKEEEAWNEGKIPILLVHPQSSGHGLNLQRGGCHLCIYDLFYSLELYLQLVGRLDRTGQTKQVMVYLLSARGTIDEYVAERLRQLQSAEESMFRRILDLHRAAKLEIANV